MLRASSTDPRPSTVPLLLPSSPFRPRLDYFAPLHARPQIYKKNQVPDPSLPAPVAGERPEFELDEVKQLLTDAFTGAAERHIEVGDGLDMLVIEKGDEGKSAKMTWVNLRASAGFSLSFLLCRRARPERGRARRFVPNRR